ncbi:MAG: hypothetical protein WBB96_07260 [Candidatus Dechloromonas phosphoritropha]
MAELVDELGRHALEYVRDQADSVDGLAPFETEKQVVAAGFAEIGFELREYRGGVGRECTVIEGVGIIARQHPVDDCLAGGWQPRVHCFLKVMFEAMEADRIARYSSLSAGGSIRCTLNHSSATSSP